LIGLKGLAVIDRNSLAGIVRAHEAAKVTGIQLIVGCRLDLTDGMSVLVYPTDRPAYARLCRLLSLGKKRAGKAKCIIEWADVLEYGGGLIAVLVPDEADDLCGLRLKRLVDGFGDRGYLALTLRRRPNDQLRIHELSKMAARFRVANERRQLLELGEPDAERARRLAELDRIIETARRELEQRV
jgi:error-prone DNA polymerase